MYSKKHLLEQAERLYVYDFLLVDDLASRLNLNRKTVMSWRDEYNWEKKRQDYLKSKQSFHEELYEFARKLMRDISSNMDSNDGATDTGKMSTFCRILPMLCKVKDYEDVVAQRDISESKGLTPELIAQIEKDILGINRNDEQ